MVDKIVIDNYTENFADFRKSAASFEAEDWSEADTRSKLIDTLFIDCLGWNEGDIRRELSDAGMRLDYRLSILLPTLIIEAKRSKLSFPVLPIQKPYKVKLKKLLDANPTLKEHIEQVSGYCHVWSIPYAVLTNGRTYIVLTGKRDDRMPLYNGDVYIISDILSNEVDFTDIFNLLSKQAVATGSLQKMLGHARPDVISRSVLNTYLNPDAICPNNLMSESVETILDQLFTDVINDNRDEIVVDCYVKPGTARIRDKVEEPLFDLPPVLAEKTVDIDSSHSFDEFEKTVNKRFSDSNMRPITTLVVGNVGVGKSIFLRRFFSRKRQDNVLPSGVLPFFIDFRTANAEKDRLSAFIDKMLLKQLTSLEDSNQIDLSSPEQLRQIFWQETKRFEKSAGGFLQNQSDLNRELFQELNRLRLDLSHYLPAVFAFLRNHYHLIPCIVLDNADHHDEEFQRQVYLASKELQASLKCLVFVALQESWYWHFKEQQGPLAGYHDTVFHVRAPHIRDVIARRLEVALEKFDKYVDQQLRIAFGKNMTLEPQHLRRFLENCTEIFFQNDETAIFFECVSNGNVRRGLDLFKLFMRSGHATTAEYLLSIVGQNSLAKIGKGELLRTLARGEFVHYTGSRSYIPNAFTVLHNIAPSFNPRFAAIFILELLSEKITEVTPSVGRGYVARALILDLVTKMGYQPVYFDEVFEHLIDAQLISPCIISPKDRISAKFFRITALGNYLVRELIGSSDYICLTMTDAPISDSKRFSEMSKLLPEDGSASEDDRAKALRMFLEDLTEFENAEADHIKEYPFIQSWRSVKSRINQ